MRQGIPAHEAQLRMRREIEALQGENAALRRTVEAQNALLKRYETRIKAALLRVNEHGADMRSLLAEFDKEGQP